jgi:hypothetical protein
MQTYSQGWEAQLQGLGFLDNPYDTSSLEGRRWIDGYVDCMIAQRSISPPADSGSGPPKAGGSGSNPDGDAILLCPKVSAP